MAEEVFNLSKAISTFCLQKNDYFMSAYPSKVVFGEVSDFVYQSNKRFVIHRSDFKKFYLAIQEIVSLIATDKFSNGLINSLGCFAYYWEVLVNKNIEFGIKKDNTKLYGISVNHEEFINLINCFSKLCLTSLLLKDEEIEFFEIISTQSTSDIVNFFRDKSKIVAFIQKNFCKTTYLYNLVFLFEMNIDIILIIHKFKKLVKSNEDDIELLLR